MAKYTQKEAKDWARKHIVGSTNAPTTPFKADYSLDEEALAYNVNKFAEIGLYGLMTGGNMAEAWNMTPSEWNRYTEICAKTNAGRMMLTSVILDPSVFTVVEKAKFLDKLGYDFIEVINPVIQLRSDDDLYGYFKFINDHSPLAIVLYQTATAGVVLSHGLINRLADLPMVVGIKNGINNPADSFMLRKRVGDRIVVTEPMESMYLWDRIANGAQAIFGTLEVLMFGRKRDRYFELVELANAGKFDEALAIHRELDPMRDLLAEVFMAPLMTRQMYNLAPIKYWMELVGFRMGICRPPLAPQADDATKTRIREVLLRCGAIEEKDLAKAA
jgi:4-hydroxy-tetrahydrodipicolinate synthase